MSASFWSSFECFCSNIVFDVRTDDEPMETASCPRCRRVLESRDTFEADEGGFGSRRDMQIEWERSRGASARHRAELDKACEQIVFARATLIMAAKGVTDPQLLAVVRAAIKNIETEF